MTHWLRVFFVGGLIAYRGLFNWIRPAIYIPTMLGAPLFQLIFFTKLGEYIVMYDHVRNAPSPSAALLAFCRATYEAGADLGGWDRAALER